MRGARAVHAHAHTRTRTHMHMHMHAHAHTRTRTYHMHAHAALLLEQPQHALPQRALRAEQRRVAHDVQAEARAGERIGDTAVDAEHADGPRVVGAHERQKNEVALLARKLLDRRHVHLRRRVAAAPTAAPTAAAAAAAARARARALLVQLAPDEQLLAAVGSEDGELRGGVALPQKIGGERRDEARLVRVAARLGLGLEGLGLGGKGCAWDSGRGWAMVPSHSTPSLTLLTPDY